MRSLPEIIKANEKRYPVTPEGLLDRHEARHTLLRARLERAEGALRQVLAVKGHDWAEVADKMHTAAEDYFAALKPQEEGQGNGE